MRRQVGLWVLTPFSARITETSARSGRRDFLRNHKIDAIMLPSVIAEAPEILKMARLSNDDARLDGWKLMDSLTEGIDLGPSGGACTPLATTRSQ